jgi:uncharacterized protein YnzC (UPF0291/DUF896 family)
LLPVDWLQRYFIFSKSHNFDILHEMFVQYDRGNLRTYRYEYLKPIRVHLAELLQYIKKISKNLQDLRQTIEQVTDDIRSDPAFLDKLAAAS